MPRSSSGSLFGLMSDCAAYFQPVLPLFFKTIQTWHSGLKVHATGQRVPHFLVNDGDMGNRRRVDSFRDGTFFPQFR